MKIVVDGNFTEVSINSIIRTPEEAVGAKDYIFVRYWAAVHTGLNQIDYFWRALQEGWKADDLQLYAHWRSDKEMSFTNSSFLQYAWEKTVTPEMIHWAKIEYAKNIDVIENAILEVTK